MAEPIAVLICDDDERIRTALQALIDAYPDLTLAGIAHTSAQAIELAREHRPAVAVVDWRMPGGGASAVTGIREHSPGTKILAFSAHAEPIAMDAMRQAGAHQYLIKSTSVPDIVAAIRTLATSEH